MMGKECASANWQQVELHELHLAPSFFKSMNRLKKIMAASFDLVGIGNFHPIYFGLFTTVLPRRPLLMYSGFGHKKMIQERQLQKYDKSVLECQRG
jgi:hypothetical protein